MESNYNVLIVDDDTDACHLMERIIKGEHYLTKSINRLKGFFDVVYDYAPSIIFLDNQLPDGFGVEQIPRLKRTFPELRVVLITGDAKPGLQEKAEINGADLFISKPFNKAAIKDALNRFLPSGGADHAA